MFYSTELPIPKEKLHFFLHRIQPLLDCKKLARSMTDLNRISISYTLASLSPRKQEPKLVDELWQNDQSVINSLVIFRALKDKGSFSANLAQTGMIIRLSDRLHLNFDYQNIDWPGWQSQRYYHNLYRKFPNCKWSHRFFYFSIPNSTTWAENLKYDRCISSLTGTLIPSFLANLGSQAYWYVSLLSVYIQKILTICQVTTLIVCFQ